MALFIKDTGTVPNPDGWKYYVEQTKFPVTTKNYAILYSEVVKHCKANGVAIPSEQEVIDQMCAKLHIACYESSNAAMFQNAYAMGIPLPPRVGSCCGR